ncbi:MAG: hypothetical protein ACREKS_01625 [Candidatus Rokuibacteriota bacterium]
MDSRPPSDQQAIERYRYMLRTAPPETIEQAHAEAFATLTPPQRRLVLEQLREATPPGERPTGDSAADPQTLARMATRAEIRQPGALERAFGSPRGGGLGGIFASSLLGSVAGTVLGSMVAQHFLAHTASADPSASEGGADERQTSEDVEWEDEDDFSDADDGDPGDDMGIEV